MENQRTKFVVFLGNPGREYERTRHNAGFMVLKKVLERWNAGDGKKAFSGIVFSAYPEKPERADAERMKVILLAPQRYMNRSGGPVRKMLDFYKADCTGLLIVMDDMSLPHGRIRLRASGSAGGHNGLSDIIRTMGTDCISRLRVGIDRPARMIDDVDYVLGKFSKSEMEIMEQSIQRAASAVEDWVFCELNEVMEKYNRKNDEHNGK